MNFFSTQYPSDQQNQNTSLDNLAKLVRSWKETFLSGIGRNIDTNIIEDSDDALKPYIDDNKVAHRYMYSQDTDKNYNISYKDNDIMTITKNDGSTVYSYTNNELVFYNGFLRSFYISPSDFNVSMGPFAANQTYVKYQSNKTVIEATKEIIDFYPVHDYGRYHNFYTSTGVLAFQALAGTINNNIPVKYMIDSGISINGSRLIFINTHHIKKEPDSKYYHKILPFNRTGYDNKTNYYLYENSTGGSPYLIVKKNPIGEQLGIWVYKIELDASGVYNLYMGFRNQDGTIRSIAKSLSDLHLSPVLIKPGQDPEESINTEWIYLDSVVDTKLDIK